MNDQVLFHMRAQAMLDFAEGKITETLARFEELLNLSPPLTPAQEVSCRMDRSIVLSFANRWKEAHADLSACETAAARLPRFAQRLTLGTIYHAEVKLLSNPHADGYDLTAAKETLAKLRAVSSVPWLAEELESGLALTAGEWQRASEFSSNALRLFEAEGWRKPAATMRRRMGEARMHLNQFDLAEQDLAAARSFFTEFGAPDERAGTDLILAQLDSRRGRHDHAWELVLQALAEIETLIRNFRVITEQQQFLIDKLRFYDEAFDIGLAAGGREGLLRAWTISERAKSFYLCHLLANGDVRLFDGIDPGAVARLAELEAELDSRTRAAMVSAGSDREQKVEEQNELSEQRLKLLFQMMRDNPRWAAVKAPVETDVMEAVRALPASWVPVSYFWREQESGVRLFIFFTGLDREPRYTVVSWSDEELGALKDCRELLARGYSPMDPGPALQRLRPKLFPDELVNLLSADSCILISPHSHLRGFPIHALDLAEEDYLVKHWPIQYAPTLSMVTLPRRPVTARKALFLGCPETPFNPLRLPEVEDEIGALAELWTRKHPGTVDSGIVPRQGSPAALGFAISKWREYRILHISCHGEFPPGRPFDAALLLGTDKVHASELFTVPLEASLVTLSACNLGKPANAINRTSSDEWVGMYLPIFYAGAGRLLVSLWEADSSTSKGIMECLNLGISQGESPARALQQTLSSVSENTPVQLWANWYLVGAHEDGNTTDD